jgi:uncharacterized protein
MKPSRYNMFVNSGNGQIIAYNALSRALSCLNYEQYKKIQELLTRCHELQSTSSKNNEYLSFLIEGRFLIEEDCDELSILKTRNLLGKLNQDKLGVTIIPTLNCNFRCVYCFIAHKNETMSQEVQDTLVEWIRLQMRHRRRLEIGWFGGEPLLRLDIIRELTAKFRNMCQEIGSEYTSEMATNGYLLTKNVTQELKELGISKIQVALDGPARIHDGRRPLAGGGPTFKVILSNLIDLIDEGGITLMLYPVIDKGTFKGLYELLDTLVDVGVHDKLIFNPQKVEPSPVNDLSCLGNSMPSPAEFAEIRANLMIYASQRGFKIDPPDVLCQACPAHNINSYMVTPKGELFKCGSFMRQEDRVGRLDPDNPQKAHIDFSNLWKWVGSDPFEDEQCRMCNVLPLCMGGCHAMRELIGGKEGHCIYYRYNLEKELVGRYGFTIEAASLTPVRSSIG